MIAAVIFVLAFLLLGLSVLVFAFSGRTGVLIRSFLAFAGYSGSVNVWQSRHQLLQRLSVFCIYQIYISANIFVRRFSVTK